MQLCHGFDAVNFPFVLATDNLRAQVFFVNVNTKKRVPLINLKKVHVLDNIMDIQQTSKFHDPAKPMHISNLKEITLHFKMNQHNKDGNDRQLIYCQLKLANEAIKLLLESKGAIPNTFMHAF